ncbi:hypothetical protein [Flavobacterium sp.]|uniref:hypothetical protein n=1 Tax=Flavobacterium sp. TaxID=239 RepID=UPI0037514F96
MVAETAFNVIQSLPQQELYRLYKLLEVIPQNTTEKPIKKRKNSKTTWTLELVKDSLLATHFKKSKKR